MVALRQVARASALLPEAARARWIDAPEEERREWLQLQSYRASLALADRPDFDALSRDEQRRRRRWDVSAHPVCLKAPPRGPPDGSKGSGRA